MIEYDGHHWWRHLYRVKGTMVREISLRVLSCVIWSAGITIIYEAFLSHKMSVEWLAIPATAHTLLGLAMSLLLVFRTNASYDRFWEGRKLWGAMVNDTRNLARTSSVWLAGDRQAVADIVAWTSALCWSAAFRLRGWPVDSRAMRFLNASQSGQLLSAPHAPLASAREVSLVVQRARHSGLINDYLQTHLDSLVNNLISYIGGCERIHKTPLPYAYVVHLRRVIVVYCYTLPMALVGAFGWGTIIVAFIATYVLYGIEEIGVEIEDPFGEDENDLPLEGICKTIDAGLEQMLAAADAGRKAASP